MRVPKVRVLPTRFGRPYPFLSFHCPQFGTPSFSSHPSTSVFRPRSSSGHGAPSLSLGYCRFGSTWVPKTLESFFPHVTGDLVVVGESPVTTSLVGQGHDPLVCPHVSRAVTITTQRHTSQSETGRVTSLDPLCPRVTTDTRSVKGRTFESKGMERPKEASEGTEVLLCEVPSTVKGIPTRPFPRLRRGEGTPESK